VNLKIKGASGKYILKRALEKVLPEDLLYRPKRGFGAPIREWFRGKSGEELDALITNSSLRKRELFDYRFIERLCDEHRRGARDWSFHLWALLNVSLWYDRWIGK
jgi:asparagine synthase (glutamine-hydrolysing)